MHPDLSHGKCMQKLGVVELSWIQPLYCLQHIAKFPLVNTSELDLFCGRVEDRYFKPNFSSKIIKYWEVFIERLGFISRKNFTRMWSKTLFNPRSNILTKSSKIPILDLNITRIHMDTVYRTTTGSFSNWKVHSTSTMMFNLHVCHLQRHILDWILQKNNVSQVDGDL